MKNKQILGIMADLCEGMDMLGINEPYAGHAKLIRGTIEKMNDIPAEPTWDDRMVMQFYGMMTTRLDEVNTMRESYAGQDIGDNLAKYRMWESRQAELGIILELFRSHFYWLFKV